jgi:hypothetical protein
VLYYLLKPDTTVLWTDAPDSVVRPLIEKRPDAVGNLENLGWKKADRRFDAGLVNIALRKGVAVPSGLIVSAGDLQPLDYYQQMQAILVKEQQRDSAAVPHAGLMENLSPGWTEETRQLDDRVQASQVETVNRAKQGLIRALSAPVSDPLAEHWQNLGGGLPPDVPVDFADQL